MRFVAPCPPVSASNTHTDHRIELLHARWTRLLTAEFGSWTRKILSRGNKDEEEEGKNETKQKCDSIVR
jgi:hypothetical protein